MMCDSVGDGFNKENYNQMQESKELSYVKLQPILIE